VALRAEHLGMAVAPTRPVRARRSAVAREPFGISAMGGAVLMAGTGVVRTRRRSVAAGAECRILLGQSRVVAHERCRMRQLEPVAVDAPRRRHRLVAARTRDGSR